MTDEVNDYCLEIFNGDTLEFLSADEALETQIDYDIGLLNTLNPSGMPRHHLRLKINCVMILLRTLDKDNGLSNGTRLILINITKNLLKCKIVGTNKIVFIPRIFNISGKLLPFKLRRCQYPVRLAFAITINKSQGQTFQKLGIYLPTPVFAHGQLYVALSRVGSEDKVKVFLRDRDGEKTNKTNNIVYTEALRNTVYAQMPPLKKRRLI
jgi:ATP-dependent DNA helicase PIF1